MQTAAPSSSSSSGQDSEPAGGERGTDAGTPGGRCCLHSTLQMRDSVDTCVQGGQEGREVWGEGRVSGEHQPGARWPLTL